MSRIEELPDDFDETLNLDDESPIGPTRDAGEDHDGSALDEPEDILQKTLKDWSTTPLFMNSKDVAEEADEQNHLLDAIRALQYEGTKYEVAQNFKEQGNELFRTSNWEDAREFYTKGIAVLTDKETDKYEKARDSDDESTLLEQLYGNRAQCNFKLKNYRTTNFDCAAVLKLNVKNVKAYYRSACALYELDKLQEAYDSCQRGLHLEPDNTALRSIDDTIKNRAKVLSEKAQKAKTERLRQQRERQILAIALKARNIRLRGSAKPPDLEDASIRLSPDPLSPKSLLEFPTLILYPLNNQSDFIKAFAEKDTIFDHLSYLLPLPWDSGKEYTIDKVECYMDTSTRGMVKVGKNSSLLKALTSGKTEVVDGLVRIHVVPSPRSSQWIDEVKKKKASNS